MKENKKQQESSEKDSETAKGQKLGWEKSLLLYLHDLIYMLAIVLVIFLLFFRVVVVSGFSMYSTLTEGDYLLLVGNLFYRDPKVGDVIVASKDSFDHGAPIIKRVIATEGQTVDIDFEKGVVYVDGEALEEDYTNTPTNLQEGMTFPLVVEENCVFAMGDNRNDSKDSRSPEIGQVDRREILGKAVLLMLPGADKTTDVRDYSRIGAVK